MYNELICLLLLLQIYVHIKKPKLHHIRSTHLHRASQGFGRLPIDRGSDLFHFLL
jgi:hypothetical protein